MDADNSEEGQWLGLWWVLSCDVRGGLGFLKVPDQQMWVKNRAYAPPQTLP